MLIKGSPTKGRLVIVSDVEGISGKVKEFTLNPNEVNDMKTTNWGALNVAGVSHPVYQFGSGGERIISFELYLNADIKGKEVTVNGKLSLTEELAWYRMLLYPSWDNTDIDSQISPPIMSFSLGELYKSVQCIVKQADIKVTYFTPDMRPIRASVVMQLAEVADTNFKAMDVVFGEGRAYNQHSSGLPQLPVGNPPRTL